MGMADRLTRLSPEKEKLWVLRQKLKKADDVLRLLSDDEAWAGWRNGLIRFRGEVDRQWRALAEPSEE